MKRGRRVDALTVVAGLRGLRQASAAAAAGAAVRATRDADMRVKDGEDALERVGAGFAQHLGASSRFDPQLAGAWATAWQAQQALVVSRCSDFSAACASESARRAEWNVQLALETAASEQLRRAKRLHARERDDRLLADLAEQAGKARR